MPSHRNNAPTSLHRVWGSPNTKDVQLIDAGLRIFLRCSRGSMFLRGGHNGAPQASGRGADSQISCKWREKWREQCVSRWGPQWRPEPPAEVQLAQLLQDSIIAALSHLRKWRQWVRPEAAANWFWERRVGTAPGTLKASRPLGASPWLSGCLGSLLGSSP